MLLKEKKEVLVVAISDYIRIHIPSFDVGEHADTSFSRLGLDSLGHVGLTTVIEETLSIELEPDFAFNYPTVNAVIQYLGQKHEQRENNYATA